MGTVGNSYSYNAICDVCGFQFKGHELKKRWDGLMVCDADYETRHPMDFYRVKNDHHKLPFVRTETTQASGYLPDDYTSFTANVGPEPGTVQVGNYFTVGNTARVLYGINDFSPVGQVRLSSDAGYKVALWDQLGTRLKTWTGVKFNYQLDDQLGIYTGQAPLMPAYILAAGTSYMLTILIPDSTSAVQYHNVITATNPYLSLSGSYFDATDIFPPTPIGSYTYTFDVITRSNT